MRHDHRPIATASEVRAVGAARGASWIWHPHVRTAWFIGHTSALGVLFVLFLSVVTEDVYPTSVQLTVSATVLKKVWAHVAGSPSALRVSAADLARGYVDVPQPTVLIVRNNSEDGFVLSVEADPGLVSRVRVTGLPRGGAEFAPTGGFLVQPGYLRQEARFELRWRVYLTAEAKEGPYPWPLLLHVQAN